MSCTKNRDSGSGRGKGDDRGWESKRCWWRQVTVWGGSLGWDWNEGPSGVLYGNSSWRESGWRGQFGKTHLSTGSNCSIDGKLTLGEVVLEVVENSDPHGVFHVKAFNICHVASNFGHTLTESHDPVVKESTSVGIGRERVSESY